MATYIALLRGVNVGGNTLKMERLRELCAELGFTNTRTYVQSGNVVFQAKGSAAVVMRALEQKLAGETRLPVSVMVRTPAQLSQVVARNPFLKDRTVDRARLHVTFLASSPPKDAAKRLAAIESGADHGCCLGQEIYLHCPTGYGNTKLSNTRLEKVLGVRASTRNWNTVNTLCEMAAE